MRYEKYDLERLKAISIVDVLESLGAYSNNGRNYHCFNVQAHKDNDKNASLSVYKNTNTCKCFACEVSGSPITVAKIAFNGDFVQACEYLHSKFNIPYLNGVKSFVKQVKQIFSPAKNKTEIKYMFFDTNKEYIQIDKLASFIDKYSNMNKAQKLKMVYSTIYRFSLSTDQKAKNLYYHNRGIKHLDSIEKIGFLSYKDIKNLEHLLLSYFPLEDLIEFKVFNQTKKTWNYSFNVAFIPCFDLYSNLVTNFSLRAIDSTYNGVKELNISCSNIVLPMPFGLNNKEFRECEKVIIAEGHIDALSAKTFYQDRSVSYITFGGVFNHREEMLTLFKNKKVFLCFDKDEAGLKGEKALSEKLNSLNISNFNLTWDIVDGKDLNDLLKANKMNTIHISA